MQMGGKPRGMEYTSVDLPRSECRHGPMPGAGVCSAIRQAERCCMSPRPKVCPRCSAGSVFEEDDSDGLAWYCLICGWRENAAPSPIINFSARPRHAGTRL